VSFAIPPDSLRTIDEFIKDPDLDTLVIRTRSGSPWIEFDVWVHLRGMFKFAVWKSTLAVHEVFADGSVTDDGIDQFPTHISPHRNLTI
jgi:hypothetical protein